MQKVSDFVNIFGTKIYLKEHYVSGSKIALLVIHGMCEHFGRYKTFTTQLKNNGISVYGVDLRGHGHSDGRRGDIEDIDKVVEDINFLINHIQNKRRFDAIGVFGHSMGGEIAVLYAGTYPKKPNFLILSNPVLYLPKRMKFLKIVPFKNNPHISFKKTVSETPEMLERSLKDPLAANVFNLRTVNQVFFKGVKKVGEVIDKICCPVLFLRGEKDTLLTNSQKEENFFNSLKVKNKQFISYKESNHRIVQNENAIKHINDIILWIKTNFKKCF